MKNSNIIAELKKAGWQVSVNHYRFFADTVNKVREAEARLKGPNVQTDPHFIDRVAEIIGVNEHDLIHISTARQTGQVNNISPRGGITAVIVKRGDADFHGSAHCSLADNYNRRRGLSMALGRLLSTIKAAEKSNVATA